MVRLSQDLREWDLRALCPFLANEQVDDHGYWHSMMTWGLMMMVVVEGVEMKVGDAKYVEEGSLEVSFCCLCPLTASLVTALQHS